MIKLVNEPEDVLNFPHRNLYTVKIKSLLTAYGASYDFMRFYCQYDDSENITAVISKLDGDFTVAVADGFDDNELNDFLNIIGFSTVLCDATVLIKSQYSEGVVMQTKAKVERFLPFADICEYPKLMDLFNFTDYEKTDFESWYVDISHRIRHNCAKAYTLNINNEIISSAIFSSIYNNDAVLSAVKTENEFRSMGYGSALVSYMTNDISGDVFLMRDAKRNEEFYKKLGFENTGLWRIYR